MIECNMQRFFDFLFSGFALIILSPILLISITVLKFTGEGEIFFRQERVGFQGEKFFLLKFATMLKNSPNLGTGTITVKNDPRVLPFGKFLRSSKINELPQLINVICGQMSLIGPRPLTEENFAMYSNEVKKSIKLVKPGLSGIGSIIFRDEEKFFSDPIEANDLYRSEIAPFKGAVEIWYVKNNNIYTYFVLIILTVVVILTRSSKISWKIFPDLPKPTDFLKSKM